jgi:hypothetical protein
MTADVMKTSDVRMIAEMPSKETEIETVIETDVDKKANSPSKHVGLFAFRDIVNNPPIAGAKIPRFHEPYC